MEMCRYILPIQDGPVIHALDFSLPLWDDEQNRKPLRGIIIVRRNVENLTETKNLARGTLKCVLILLCGTWLIII